MSSTGLEVTLTSHWAVHTPLAITSAMLSPSNFRTLKPTFRKKRTLLEKKVQKLTLFQGTLFRYKYVPLSYQYAPFKYKGEPFGKMPFFLKVYLYPLKFNSVYSSYSVPLEISGLLHHCPSLNLQLTQTLLDRSSLSHKC